MVWEDSQRNDEDISKEEVKNLYIIQVNLIHGICWFHLPTDYYIFSTVQMIEVEERKENGRHLDLSG